MRRLLMAALVLVCLGPATGAEMGRKPIWSKAATPIDGHCGDVAPPPQRITAPDGISEIEYRCAGSDNYRYHLRARTAGGPWQKLTLNPSTNPDHDYLGADEVLWAPDSQSFFITGNENAYTNYLLFYHKDERGWHVSDIATKIQRDMVRLFPPCKDYYPGNTDCKRTEKEPDFNMAGIAWTRGGAGLIIFAEVPCSSSYGHIMCAVEGYEVAVPSGEILTRYTAKQFKAAWQKAMVWQFHIPSPLRHGAVVKQQ